MSDARLTNFAVRCVCGQTVAGRRGKAYRPVSCPGCGSEYLIRPAVEGAAQARRRLWPAAVAVAAVLAAAAVASLFLFRADSEPAGSPGFDGHLEAAERRAEVEQRRREAAVVADLLFESLPEVLTSVPGVPRGVAAAEFARRYRGRAVLFDAAVSREGGAVRVDYELRTREGPVDVRWGELAVFDGLPLAEPTRLIFGVRLDKVERDAAGRWTLFLEADGGVLLTDGRVLACTALPSLDEQTRAALARQARWVGTRRSRDP